MCRRRTPRTNQWTWEYDARRRVISSTDPDTGTSSCTYDKLDRKVTSTDARNTTVWTGYDALGRTAEKRPTDSAGTRLTSFTYDTLPGAVGQPVASTRYTDGAAYANQVTGYDAEYRPTGQSITILDTTATKGLAGTYTYTFGHTPSGQRQTLVTPAAGTRRENPWM